MAIWGGPQVAARLPLEKPLILSEHSGPHSWAGNGFYERFARPQGLVDTLLVVLEYNPSLVGTVGFGRHESMPPISKAQTKALSIFAPHFRRAAVLSRLMVARSQMASAFCDVIEGLRLPVFLVRSDLSVVHQNAAGTRLAHEFRGCEPLVAASWNFRVRSSPGRSRPRCTLLLKIAAGWRTAPACRSTPTRTGPSSCTYCRSSVAGSAF